MEPKSFGQLIRESRLAKGLTQKELAASLKKPDGGGISPQYLNDIEHDRRYPPTNEVIRQIAGMLELNEDLLLITADRVPADIREIGLRKPERVEQLLKEFRRRSRG